MGVVLSLAFVPVFVFMVFLLNGSFSQMEGRAAKGFADMAVQAEGQKDTALASHKAELAKLKQEETFKVLAAIFACTATVGLVMLILLFVMFRKLVGHPLGDAVSHMKELANGKTDVDIAAPGRSDEIGDILSALRVFRDSAVERETLRHAREKQVQKVAALCGRFETDISAFLSELTSAIAMVQESATGLYDIASQNDGLSSTLEQSVERVNGNVGIVASLTEKLSASVQNISTQVQEANALVEGTMNGMHEAQSHAAALNGASEKINAILDLIGDVSHQTKLLALNATIEAARAGEAGKSFAVVAHEVKNLASQTEKSVGDIGRTIGEIKGVASSIRSSLTQVGKSVEQVDMAARMISQTVAEQSDAAAKISQNMQAASDATYGVSCSVSQVTATAKTTGEASNNMKGSAERLARCSEAVQASVEQFLKAIKAA